MRLRLWLSNTNRCLAWPRLIPFLYLFFFLCKDLIFVCCCFTSAENIHKGLLGAGDWVPGEIKRSRDLRGGRWNWTLKLAQKRSWVGRWSWAEKVRLLLLRLVQVVRQQQCNGHCLCDSAKAQQLKQQLCGAQVAGQWRGDTALTFPLFWRRSTVSPVFFGRFPRSSLHSFVPFPLCPRP